MRSCLMMTGRKLFLIVALFLLTGCAVKRTPIAPGVVPRQTEMQVTAEDEQYGHEVLGVLTETYPLDTDDNRINRVRDIVDRLTRAAESDRNPWHVYVLVGDDVANAAATRGNYIFVWTGLLKHITNDDQLAAVLGHEIGHVLAGHTRESPAEEANRIMAEVVGQVTAEVVAQTSAVGGSLAGIAGALVSEVIKGAVLYPESQRMELEADHIGLFLMADSGYDPKNAADFWRVMQNIPGNSEMPFQFLSTHPASNERIKAIESYLPEAEARYRHVKGGGRPQELRRQNSEYSTASNSVYGTVSGAQVRVSNLGGGSVAASDSQWVVSASEAPVFTSPQSRAVISYLSRGEQVTVVEQDQRWFRITAPVEGYIRSSLIQPVDR